MTIGWLARWYRWIEYLAFGKALERRRFAFLPRLASAHRILVLGEGDGRTLARLLQLAPLARVDVMEISPEMIALAKQRTGDYSDRVAFRRGDAGTASWATGHYDAIITNFFLDCFTTEELRDLVPRLASALRPEGLWLNSEFAIPSSGWRRLHAQLWISTMYRFFNVATALRATKLPPIERVMRENGMVCIERQAARAGLMVSEVWSHASGQSTHPPTCDVRQTLP